MLECSDQPDKPVIPKSRLDCSLVERNGHYDCFHASIEQTGDPETAIVLYGLG